MHANTADLGHGLEKNLGLLFLPKCRRRQHERSNAGVENGVNLQRIAPDVFVLGEKDPAVHTHRRQPVNVLLSGEMLIPRLDVVSRRDQHTGNVPTETFVDVEN